MIATVLLIVGVSLVALSKNEYTSLIGAVIVVAAVAVRFL
jgi:hypothetical protein